MQLSDIEKSDKILCDNWSYSQFHHKEENDRFFVNQFMQTQPTQIRDVDKETVFFQTQNLPNKVTCNRGVLTRGGNISCEEPRSCKTYGNYTKYNMADWLLIPCTKPTYRNYIVEDCRRGCTMHQMFDNCTKRTGDSWPMH